MTITITNIKWKKGRGKVDLLSSHHILICEFLSLTLESQKYTDIFEKKGVIQETRIG